MLTGEVAEFTMRGGKRTRAFLCWLGAQTTKETRIFKKLHYAMMALELFQSFALIHDDIIDEDTTRRGAPSVHEHFRINASKHFGTSMAILAGDLALAWADELMLNAKDAFVIYQKMKEDVVYGQTLDVVEEYMKPGIPKALIDTNKTAWYSVIRPIQIGACLGGANADRIESFVPYGLAVGRAYQLRDDVLDGVISEETFRTQAAKYEKQAAQAVQAIRAPVGILSLLGDFAHFALTRLS